MYDGSRLNFIEQGSRYIEVCDVAATVSDPILQILGRLSAQDDDRGASWVLEQSANDVEAQKTRASNNNDRTKDRY